MAIITINLDEEQVEKTRIILRELRDRHGEGVSRSEVFRQAIDNLFMSMCLTDKTNIVPERHCAETVNA
jgi:hypothetical protein